VGAEGGSGGGLGREFSETGVSGNKLGNILRRGL